MTTDEPAGEPSVSVVIPTRDRWTFLEETLASALAQEEVSLEVIVVDDGSSARGASGAALADRRVRVIRHETSLGVARARNAGVAAARGRWVAFLDDDDLWAPDKLSLQLAAAEGAGASFAYASVVLVTAELGRVKLAPAPDPEELRELLRRFNAIPAGASNLIARTDLVRDAGGFDPSFTHLADWDMWIRLAERGRGAACTEPLVGYRLHPSSMRSSVGGAIREMDRLDRKHGHPARPPAERIWFYRWLVDGQLLAGNRRAAAATSARGAIRCRSSFDAWRAARIPLQPGGYRDAEPPEGDLARVAAEDWIRPLLAARRPRGEVGHMRLLAARAVERALRLSGLKAGLAVVYHGLEEDPDAPDASGPVSRDAFREQVAHMSGDFRLVRAGELRDAAMSRRRGARFPLAITFDDDLRSHLDLALPILREQGSTATFFLTGASLEGPASFWWLAPEEPGLQTEHVAALAATGCEIGFHTRGHERLPGLTGEELAAAMRDGVDELSAAAGAPLRSIAYPHGAADDRVAAAAGDGGFRSGFTTEGRAVRADTDPLLMGRLYPNQTSPARLASQLSLVLWSSFRG